MKIENPDAMYKFYNQFSDNLDELVTVVLTSCGRLNYLMQTIESFYKYNTFPIYEFIIVEDSGNKKMHKSIRELYPYFTIICNEKNIGLVESIDKGYSKVKTPFIFHCEDDWEFYRSGFIEKSLEILVHYPEILQVWIRAMNDTNTHPVENKIYEAGEVQFRLMETNALGGNWHGFSWNPGLRRLADYRLLAPFSKIAPDRKAGEREMIIGKEYYKLGFRAAILPEGYVKHIGLGPKNYSLA